MVATDPHTTAHETMRTWAAAELAGDTEALAALLTDDFAGIGPHGFQLDKDQWLDRYRSGNLVNEEFNIEDIAVRHYGTVSVVNAVQAQQAAYQGHPVDGRFRCTAVLARTNDAWRLANIQLSTMASP